MLEGLKARLLDPAAIAHALTAYHRAAAARRTSAAVETAPIERRLAETRRGLERLVDAVARGIASQAMEARIAALEAERLDLEGQLARLAQATAAAPVRLHPRAATLYAQMVDQLQATLADAATRDTPATRELIDAVRALITTVTITPRSADWGAPFDLELHGRLALFLQDDGAEPSEIKLLGAVVPGAQHSRGQYFVPFKVAC